MEDLSNRKMKYKIYLRTDEKNIVTKVFCNAFEQPTSQDFFLEETEDRQAANQYILMNEKGEFIYEWKDKLIKREIPTETEPLFVEDTQDKTEKNYLSEKEKQIKVLKEKLQESDYKTLKYVENELSEEEFETIKMERKAWRAEINALQMQE